MTLNICAEEPALLVVDDLHWCDRPSLRYLAYLANRLDGAPIGLADRAAEHRAGRRPRARRRDHRRGLGGRDPPRAAERGGGRPGRRGALRAGGRRRVQRRLRASHRRQPAAARRAAQRAQRRGHRPDRGRRRRDRPGRSPGDLPDGAAAPRAGSRRRRRRSPAPSRSSATAPTSPRSPRSRATTPPASRGSPAPSRGPRSSGRELRWASSTRSSAPRSTRTSRAGERQLQHARAAELMNEAGANVDKVAAQLLAAPPTGEPWAAERLTQAAAMASASGAASTAPSPT